MKNNIYRLREGLKNIGRGDYPQIQHMIDGYDYKSDKSVNALDPRYIPDFIPNFNYPVVRDGSILTDLLSHSPIPHFVLIITNKLLKILLDHKLPRCKIYPVTLFHRGNKINNLYKAIYIIDPYEHLKYIDFKNSKFWIRDLISHKKLKKLNILSYNELQSAFLEAKNQISSSKIWAEELVMQNSFYDKYDIFSLMRITFPIDFKVTHKLKEAIEKENCTGVSFENLSESKDKLKDFMTGNVNTTFFPIKPQTL